jgi:hypothetical protein
VRRARLDDVRAAMWTFRSVLRCRRQIGSRQLSEIALPESEGVSGSSGNVVAALLRRRRDECLANALILQAWRADHGDLVDVVIGVRGPGSGFTAHAWLADSAEEATGGHLPIHRLAPNGNRSRSH